MIDTHCHLIPMVDDGPRTPSAAIELARRLLADGVTRVLCTPHYSGLFPTDHGETVVRLDELRALMAELGIELETGLAAEVGLGYAVAAPLEELLPRSIARKFLLVEVPPDASVASFETVFERLGEAGLTPIYAHPERARTIQRDPGVLADVRRGGALVQVVAPSVLGRWGRGAQAASWFLLDRGLVDLLASDAHGARRRTVHLREVAELVAARLGAHAPFRLLKDNPGRILQGLLPG